MVALSRALPRPETLFTDVLKNIDRMSKARVLAEFWSFLRQEKKYWLMPIVFVFLLFGILLIFAQSSALAPFIYSLF
jgi:hypothetical protein